MGFGRCRSLPAVISTLERTPANRRMIQACVRRWRAHNKYGRSLGRGLSEPELLERVALETGASRTHILEALKSDG